MKLILINLFLLILTIQYVRAQHSASESQSGNEYLEAVRLAGESKYDSSNILFKKISMVFKKNGGYREYYDCLNKMAENLWRMGNYAESKNLTEKVISEFREPQAERSEAFINLGIVNEFLGDYEIALKYYRNAIEIQKGLADSSSLLSKTYSNIGIFYFYQNKYDSALTYFHKSIQIDSEKSNNSMLGIYNNMGAAFENLFVLDSALIYYNKALYIAKTESADNPLYIAKILGNIGLVYSNKGEINLAIEYTRQAIEFYTMYNINQPDLGDFYSNLGYFYFQLKKFDDALIHQENALKLKLKYYESAHPKIGISHFHLGVTLINQNEISVALEHLEKALEIALNSDENSDRTALIYGQLSNIYFKLNKEKEAINYYRKAAVILEGRYNRCNESLSSINGMVAENYYQKRQYNESLFFLQKALIANSIKFSDSLITQNPSTHDCRIPIQQLELFAQKGKVALHKAEITRSSDVLIQQALNSFKSCDTLISNLQSTHNRFEDKVIINRISFEVYSSLIYLNLRLFLSSKNDIYLQNAFLYSEKSKSRLLTQALDHRLIKNSGGIDKSDLVKESQLSHRINYYQSQLLSQNDKTLIKKYEKLLFENRIKKDSLKQVYKKKYPDYYRLRYANQIASVKDLQSHILYENQALIEYFLGDSSLCIFTITKSDFDVNEISIDSIFHSHFNLFRSSLTNPKLTKQTLEGFRQYISASSYLYQKLLLPVQEYIQGKDLIIVPDGKLALIPFEALLTESPKVKKIDHSELPYLLNTHNVSYANSGTTLLNNSKSVSSSENNQKILAFAPSFDNEQVTPSKRDTVRSTLGPLAWTQKEVNSLVSYFKGLSYLGEDATEKVFKENADEYEIIHIASHSMVDDLNPMYSKIAFTLDQEDTLNDGYLHTFELYSTQLNAEMVVLSACNTGYGKVEKGEGVLSLGYAFSYAGVPSVVMSHWQVDDKSTYLFMDNFYKFLSEGMNKSEALRRAKLYLLDDENAAYANPYYWSTFVAYGKDTPVAAKSTFWIWFLISSFTISLIMIFYVKKAKLN